MSLEKIEYLIVGGGITGLTFANFIDNNNYILLEKEKELGGYCKTIHKKNYVWDYAGHFFHFTDNELKNFFKSKIIEEELIYKEKNTKIYFKGGMIDYPFQKNIHQLPKNDFISCLYDLYNRNKKNKYKNFKEMLYGKFGKGITEKFLVPYNEKLYSCDLTTLEANAMGRFFPYADLNDIIDNMKESNNDSYNDEFLYPKNGAVTFIKALEEEIDSNKIFLDEELIDIDLRDKIAFTNKRKIKFNYLINTSPFNDLINFINPNKSLEYLNWNKVLVFNIGFNKKSNFKDIHWLYVPSKNINFYRIGFYDNILDDDKLSLYVEIGYSKDAKINIKDQFDLTIKNLEEIGIINNGHKVEASSSIIMDPAYVHISDKSKEIKKEYDEILIQKNIYSIGRYGGWQYCSMEDSMLEAKNLAFKINELKNIENNI